MNVVTYARVSTLYQESEGQSLANQERAFTRWIAANGHTRRYAYREAASAKDVEGRVQFRRMIAELPTFRPDAIVVDTLDRFTRNLREGLELLEQLRGHHVGLLPLDWRRDRPIDVDDDHDWAEVVDEFTSAERERRRIRRRVRRAYEGRRERGATTTNRAPFGLRKVGDRIEPDPQTAWLVAQVDAELLAGRGLNDTLDWVRAQHAKAWTSRTGLTEAMANEAYVRAGIRTPEAHAQLRLLLDQLAARFGRSVKRPFEFTGVFECGYCGGRMHGRWANPDVNGGYESIVCDTAALAEQRHRSFWVAAKRVAPIWAQIISEISTDPERLREWARGGPQVHSERALHRKLAQFDQRSAALKKRRDAALDLFAEGDGHVRAQARLALSQLGADEQELEMQRQTVVAELAVMPAAATRDPAELAASIAAYRKVYDRATVARRNALNRALVAAIGSHPTIVRGELRKESTLRIEWPGVLFAPIAVPYALRGRAKERHEASELRRAPV